MRLLSAVEFAELAHRGQVRKYTGVPYITHPLEVAQIVSAVGADEDVVIAALLHDVVEDTPVTLNQIAKAFGPIVARLVHEVTDISRPHHGNRKARKALDRQHLSTASPNGMTIKLADLISNTQSIAQHDPAFAKVYMREKKELMPLLHLGNAALLARASGLIAAWEQTERATDVSKFCDAGK
jgi:(p)ppGpp synthase/HD superfamily hydrolase